jgi:hypothetical protein
MKRSHALVLALLLGAAAMVATYAVLRTTSLATGANAAPAVSSADIAARSARLDKAQKALRRALARKPPALPKLPERVTSQSRLTHVAQTPAQLAPSPPSATSQPSSESEHEVDSEGEHDD